MNIVIGAQVRANLHWLIDDSAVLHQPVIPKGTRHLALLTSAADRASVPETLFLKSVAETRQRTFVGLNTPVNNCETELVW